MSVISMCQAQNPSTCRYHGSSGMHTYQQQAETQYHEVLHTLETTTNLNARYQVETALREAAVEYAATEQGAAEFQAQLTDTGDWTEKERLRQLLEDGERYRYNIENKSGGIVKFPASKLSEAVTRIEKANRKLERAGVTERFTYTTEEYTETDSDGHTFSMIRMELSHPTISVGGWDFVAAVDKTEDGSMVTRTIPSQELNGYRPEHFQCDHCGSNRRRNSTYLLRNQKGEIKQVGSNCLESFTGVKPKALWALNYDPENENNYIDRGERRWGGADSAIPTKELVAAALAVSNNGENYRSKNFANEWGGTSTSDDVKSYFFGNTHEWDGVDHNNNLKAAQNMIANTPLEGDSDYATNMRTLVPQEYTSYKHIGYVSSLIAAAQRQQRAQERAAVPRAVGYLGQEGDKLRNINLTVKKVHHSSSSFNGRSVDKTMLVMSDDSGREVKWWATGYREYSQGDMLFLKSATVTDHDQFNGNEQTVIKNGRIQEAESST